MQRLITALKNVVGDVVPMRSEDPMGDFIKDINNFALVKETERGMGGHKSSDQYHTVDITTTGDLKFTIDYLDDKGFLWVDFNQETSLGRTAKQAAKKFKDIVIEDKEHPEEITKR